MIRSGIGRSKFDNGTFAAIRELSKDKGHRNRQKYEEFDSTHMRRTYLLFNS